MRGTYTIDEYLCHIVSINPISLIPSSTVPMISFTNKRYSNHYTKIPLFSKWQYYSDIKTTKSSYTIRFGGYFFTYTSFHCYIRISSSILYIYTLICFPQSISISLSFLLTDQNLYCTHHTTINHFISYLWIWTRQRSRQIMPQRQLLNNIISISSFV